MDFIVRRFSENLKDGASTISSGSENCVRRHCGKLDELVVMFDTVLECSIGRCAVSLIAGLVDITILLGRSGSR